MNLQDKSITELTTIYNEIAAENGLKVIKKFSTKGEAVARVEKAQAQYKVKKPGGGGGGTGPGRGRSVPRLYSADATIKILVDGNPMREGKRSYEQFAVLAKHDGKTVADYLTSFSKTDLPAHLATATLRWCVDKEFASLQD